MCEIAKERAFEVIVLAGWRRDIEHRLHFRVLLFARHVCYRSLSQIELLIDIGAVWARAAMTHGNGNHGMSMADHQGSIGRKLIGSIAGDIAITAQKVKGAASGIEQKTAMHRLERMQTELERRDDAEVTASPSNRPEHVFILRRTHRQVC